MLKVAHNPRSAKCSNTLRNIHTNARENITRTVQNGRRATFSWPTLYKPKLVWALREVMHLAETANYKTSSYKKPLELYWDDVNKK